MMLRRVWDIRTAPFSVFMTAESHSDVRTCIVASHDKPVDKLEPIHPYTRV